MSSLVVLRREKYLRIISYRTTSMAHIGQRNSNFINKLVGSTRVSEKFKLTPPEKKVDKPPEKKSDKPPEKKADKPPEKKADKTSEKKVDKPPKKKMDEPPKKKTDEPPKKEIDEPPEEETGEPPEEETGEPPEKKIRELLTNVRIYILCHTQERFESAHEIYEEYKWAVPIRMKYQDYTFENAFWKQLGEIKNDWLGLEMIGTLSYTAKKKSNLNKIDRIINDRNSWSTGYFNFRDNGSELASCHPHLLEISTDVCTSLGRLLPSVAYCNYWMCTPHKMIEFIHWFETKLKPAVVSHPLSMTDAQYTQGKLSQSELLQLCGVPYYPHVPFVMERLNKLFFVPDVVPDNIE